jgi:photosystem II stability/assembly factor-like uncharacterized protein
MKRFSVFLRLYTFLSIIFFSFGAAQTADTWRWLNPKPTGSDFFAVRFIDNDTGYAVGTSTIMKTTDGGTTWKYMAPIPFEHCELCKSLSFPEDAQIGYVVGGGGHIVKTTDGGATWQNQSSGTTVTLNTVQFPIDAQTGYVAGLTGTILKTTNGGATWQHQSIGTTDNLVAMHFPEDDQTGYVLDDNHDNAGVWKTTNGGATWICQGHISLFPGSNIHFVDEHTGYVSGQNCTIYKTTNSGANWTLVGTSSSGGLCNIWFVDDQCGYVAGLDKLLKTTNAGATWTEIPLGTHDIFAWDIHFPVNGQIGYVVGSYGHIWKTTNGGATWISQRTQLLADDYTLLNSVHFVGDTGFVVGNHGTILKTTNAGETWSFIPPYGNEDDAYTCVYVMDAQNIFIGGLLYMTDCSILKTTDGGATWTHWGLYNYPNFIQFVGTQVGYCAWNNGVLKTTDAGETWVELSGVASEAQCLHFPVDDQIGYSAHTGGRIYKTTDGGATWTSQTTPTNLKVHGIYFIDNNTGYAVCGSCTGDAPILKTTNGGATWSLQASGFPYNLESVCFPQDAETGYIAAQFGNILKTTNGGLTWVTYAIAGGHGFNSICFTRENPAIGYLVGFESMILKLGDIIGIEEEQANIRIQTSDARLNIRPNPFMSYATVSGYEKERFALYDISGRLVSTCWGNRIGEGLCAGVYFVMPENKNLKPVRIVKVR